MVLSVPSLLILHELPWRGRTSGPGLLSPNPSPHPLHQTQPEMKRENTWSLHHWLCGRRRCSTIALCCKVGFKTVADPDFRSVADSLNSDSSRTAKKKMGSLSLFFHLIVIMRANRWFCFAAPSNQLLLASHENALSSFCPLNGIRKFFQDFHVKILSPNRIRKLEWCEMVSCPLFTKARLKEKQNRNPSSCL